MRRFLFSALGFVLILLILLPTVSCLRYAWLEIYARRMFRTEKWQQILVLGDSHAQCSFVEDPDCHIKMLTYHSTPLNVSLMRLKELERRGGLGNVKVCVVNFWYTTAVGHITESGQLESVWRMLPFSLRYRELIPLESFDLYCYLLKEMFVHSGNLPPVVVDPALRVESTLFCERNAQWRTGNVKRAILRHYGWKDRPEGKVVLQSDQYFKWIVGGLKEVCDRHGINLVFYSAPLTPEYDCMVPEWAKQCLEKRVEWLGEMGIRYYDFRTYGTSDIFADADHLSLEGARKFTRMFYDGFLRELL